MESKAGRLYTVHRTTLSERVFWEIDDLQEHLQQADTLLSDAFSFGGQQWRLLLRTDSTHLGAFLSRADIPDESPPFFIVQWHIGVVDKHGACHYDRSGCVSLDLSSQDWITVAEWMGPEWNHLLFKKDQFLTGDSMTLALQLCCDPAVEVCNVADLGGTSVMISDSHSTLPDDVTVTVRDRTFHVHRPDLEALSPVLVNMLYPSLTDGGRLAVHLPDCDPRAFQTVLSFLYTGTLNDIDSDKLSNVYYIADTYLVAGLKNECTRQLLAGLTTESACDVLHLPETQGDEVLRDETKSFQMETETNVLRKHWWSSQLMIPDKENAVFIAVFMFLNVVVIIEIFVYVNMYL